jgi:hypothetical protein
MREAHMSVYHHQQQQQQAPNLITRGLINNKYQESKELELGSVEHSIRYYKSSSFGVSGE